MAPASAPSRPTSTPRRSTEAAFLALDAVENALCQPLNAILQPDAATLPPKPIFEIIGVALAPIQQFFGAQTVQCWVEAPDGTWRAVGESHHSEAALRQLMQLVQTAVATERPITRTNQRFGTLMVFPMLIGTQLRGALTIARDFVQGPQGDEKAAGKFMAHRLAHAIATGLAWRNAYDHAHYWRAIFDAIPEIIIIRDANQRVLMYNEGALEAAANAEEIRAARTLKQPEPTPVWDTHLPHQKDLLPDEIPSVRAVRDQTQVRGAQMELTTHPADAEPQIIPVLATAVPLFDSAHQLMRSVTIVHDISATKRVEQMKDTFANRVRHDVNGPLTSTKIAAQLINRICTQMQAGHVAPDPQQLSTIATYAQGIEQGCATIGGITAALDDMERAISSTPIRISLVEFVRNHLHGFRARYPERPFICDVISSVDTLLEGYWCKDHVEIILNNLLENAIKYSPAGTPVTVQLKADEYEDKPMAHLIVKDQGYGIALKDQDAVFEKNVRVTPTDEYGQPIPGTGEGLHYCKIYAMMYGVKPWVRSAGKNQGSEFHVRLPLAQ